MMSTTPLVKAENHRMLTCATGKTFFPAFVSNSLFGVFHDKVSHLFAQISIFEIVDFSCLISPQKRVNCETGSQPCIAL